MFGEVVVLQLNAVESVFTFSFIPNISAIFFSKLILALTIETNGGSSSSPLFLLRSKRSSQLAS